MPDLTPPSTDAAAASLPPGWLGLARGLGRAAGRLRQALRYRPRGEREVFSSEADGPRHLQTLEDFLGNLERLLPKVERSVLADQRATQEVGERAATRIAGAVEPLLRAWRSLRRARGPEDHDEACRRLLLEVLRHYLVRMAEWMERLELSITQPAQAMQRLGAEWIGRIVLTVRLDLSPPPAMARLGDWARAHRAAREAQLATAQQAYQARQAQLAAVSPARRPSAWDPTVGLVFGMGMARWVFRHRRR